jgi:alkylresorcinol/alkylpyrone synthase
MATIAGVGEAFPDHYYPQEEIQAALRAIWKDRDIDTRRIERIHRHTAVSGRYLALPLEHYRERTSWGDSNAAWMRIGEEIGVRAIRQALDRAGLEVADVDTIVFVSVTGLATPSLDARLMNRLGFSPTVRRIPIFGLGCVAGAASLARCADLVQARSRGVALLVSVELCSLTFQRDDLSGANIVATGLFGDGAAAVLVVGRERPARGPALLDTRSIFYRDTERAMGWDISEQGFRLVLSPDIPELIRTNLRRDVDSFLDDHGLRRSDIRYWMSHTGGPKILSAIQETLDLPQDALDLSWEQMRAVGNISSASVLQVLKRTLERAPEQEGGYGLMMALGPGFCSELLLMRWPERERAC